MRITNHQNSKIFVGYWLLVLTIMCYLIILIGGLTRLTESGLSMVDWRPFLGIIPPLNDKEWLKVFEMYKKTPEFIIVNSSMTMNEFKYIFWWEFFHRFFARMIGFVFIFPFIYFLLKKQLKNKDIISLIIILLFGALQAFVGWWMVKSGLNNDPYVSQYRLSFHLTNAVIILSLLILMTLNQFEKIKQQKIRYLSINRLFVISLILTLVTIISGSFVSGTDAGKSFNTFPLMNGKFFPDGYFYFDSFFKNIFENIIAIQFNHRWLAIFTFFWTLFVVIYTLFKKVPVLHQFACYTIAIIMTLQIVLGILTLINNVPISLASLHQANAILLYCSLLITSFLFSKKT